MVSEGGLVFLTCRLFLPPICFVSKYKIVLLLIAIITCAMLFDYFGTTVSSRDCAISVCKYLYHMWIRVVYSYLNPPYLYILLNLILVTIMATSGVLKPANRDKHPCFPGDDRSNKDAATEHVTKSPKCSEYDCNIKTSIISVVPDPRKVDLSEPDIKKSDASLSVSKKFKSAIRASIPKSLSQGSITIQETTVICAYQQNPSISAFHHVVMQDSVLHTDVELGSHSDMQFLQIEESEGEMSREELNAKAEQFIMNFHRQMRQESIRLSVMESRSFAYRIE
eukprot:c43268_g1_i1 orf=241-1083(-)